MRPRYSNADAGLFFDRTSTGCGGSLKRYRRFASPSILRESAILHDLVGLPNLVSYCQVSLCPSALALVVDAADRHGGLVAEGVVVGPKTKRRGARLHQSFSVSRPEAASYAKQEMWVGIKDSPTTACTPPRRAKQVDGDYEQINRRYERYKTARTARFVRQFTNSPWTGWRQTSQAAGRLQVLSRMMR